MTTALSLLIIEKSKLSSKTTHNNLALAACQCEGKDNRIPLLKEVFEAFPTTPINIDIKVNNSVLIKKVPKAPPALSALLPIPQTSEVAAQTDGVHASVVGLSGSLLF